MAEPQKCVHKGCGKVYTDPEEPCVYHPGPPEFHEGQKGWKCCKPRVLTFDEFLEIPPCTIGKHSTVDEVAQAQEREAKANRRTEEDNTPKRVPISQPTPNGAASSTSQTPSVGAAIAPSSKSSTPAPAELEEDSDDPATPIPQGSSCKRRSCGKSLKDIPSSSDPHTDPCTFHPGVPLFHEGSKGWTCCKRRVLEFDEFLKIEGCKTRTGHCFTGKRATKLKEANKDTEEVLQEVRNDFYQTANTLIVSFYLKRIDKTKAIIKFRDDGSGIDLDLPTTDGKRFTREVLTWREIEPKESTSKVMGTKLEMVLVKREKGLGWPVLRADERDDGVRIQVGRAGRA